MTKQIKTHPVMLNYAANIFADRSLKNDDVEGRGLRMDNIERDNGDAVTRIAYSKTTPGLVVVHAYSGRVLEGSIKTFLGHRKFFASHLHPMKATEDKLAALIRATRSRRKTSWTDAEIEADIAFLLKAA